MLTRRQSLLALLSLSTAAHSIATPAVAAAGPDKVVAGLYERLRKNPNTPLPGFDFDGSDQRLLSDALRALWAEADAKAKERDDELGALNFDVVIDGQDGEVKSYKLTITDRDARHATVKVRFDRGPSFDNRIGLVEYRLVNEGSWKIDDIRGLAKDRRWSLREILDGYLKNPGF